MSNILNSIAKWFKKRIWQSAKFFYTLLLLFPIITGFIDSKLNSFNDQILVEQNRVNNLALAKSATENHLILIRFLKLFGIVFDPNDPVIEHGHRSGSSFMQKGKVDQINKDLRAGIISPEEYNDELIKLYFDENENASKYYDLAVDKLNSKHGDDFWWYISRDITMFLSIACVLRSYFITSELYKHGTTA